MTEKVKNEVKKEEASPQPVEKKEEQPSSEAGQKKKESDVSEETVVKPEDTVDYKAELEKAKKTITKQERAIVKHKVGEKKEKPKVPKVNKNKMKKEIMADVRRDIAEEFVDETLEAISSNQDERELIKHHYENTINPTGTSRSAVLKDLARAKMLANEVKIMRENAELRTALAARNSLSNTSEGTNQDKPEIDETDKYLSPQDIILFERMSQGDPKKLEELKKKAIQTAKTTPFR